jgi:hypothetical protein
MLPSGEEGEPEASVEQAVILLHGGDVGEEGFQFVESGLGQASAIFTGGVGLTQDAGGGIGSDLADGFGFYDADPHLEVGRLLDEHVFLRGEKPEEIATADLVFAVGEQIEAGAAGDEVELQFGVMVHGVGAPELAVVPEVSIEAGGQFEELVHDDKK